MLLFPHKLTETERDPASLEIFNGLIFCCKNLQKTHEEAGTVIIHHSASTPMKAITVADDTNIFVLLKHFTFTADIKSQESMQSTDKESLTHVTNIAATYQGHIKIMPNIFAAHGLPGCNKVCSYFGNGKKTVINVLNKKNINLSSIRFPHEPLENYLKQGINFLLLFYNQSKVETLNDAQKKMQKYSIEKGRLGTPKLESSGSTHKSFFQNLK